MTLSQVNKGKDIVVLDFACKGINRQRLMDLGIFKGAKITVSGLAPLGDPMIVEAGDCRIAIRKKDAEMIIVA